MEPFELALSQVNFEESDLSSSQPLHSFSNLVCYDSDFQSGSGGSPVVAKRVSRTGNQELEKQPYAAQVADAFTANGESRLRLTSSDQFYHNYGPNAYAHLVNGSDTVTVEPEHLPHSTELKKETEMTDSPTGQQVSIDQGTDSFRAFTDTVEALALQRSVIGSSGVTPASPEEIARAIAVTQRKMKTSDIALNGSQREDSITSGDEAEAHITEDQISFSLHPVPAYTDSETVQCHTSSKVTSAVSSLEVVHTLQASASVRITEEYEDATAASMARSGKTPSVGDVGTKETDSKSSDGAGIEIDDKPPMSVSTQETSQILDSTGDLLAQRSGSADERSSGAGSPQLIPVPQDMITKVTERTGGWLSGRGVVTPESARPGQRSQQVEEPTHQSHTSNQEGSGDTSVGELQNSQEDTNQIHTTVITPSESQQDSLQLEGAGLESGTVEDRPQVHRVMNTHSPTSTSMSSLDGDISGVEKLKGEYDFDTNSYLETMATFKSLQTTNVVPLQTATGTLVQEDTGHRFSPPVKDPGLQPPAGKGRPAVAQVEQVQEAKQTESMTVKKVHFEDTHVHLDEKTSQNGLDAMSDRATLPLQVPLDTSTPLKVEVGGHHQEHQSEERVSSSKRLVLTANQETTVSVVGGHSEGAPVSADGGKVPQGREEKIQHVTESVVHLSSSTKIEETHVTHSQVVLNVSQITPNSSHINQVQDSSMMVEVDSLSRNMSTTEEMSGDLSLGNSSAAAGEGASMSRSERGEYNNLKEEVATLRRVRAHLEGKVEVLEGEARVAIRERSELHSRLASLMTQLRSHESNTKRVEGERNALSADLETLKQNRHRLELVLMDAQKLIEEKDHDLKTLQEDLTISHSAGEKLQEKMKEFREQMQARDETVQALKNKVAELYVEFQTTKQGKILLENELASVQSNAKSVLSAKEWYQEQLKLSQENKSKLQQEMVRIQSESISSVTLIERLKADNVRIKQALNEQQQKALQEKEMLARHLEAIEGDMMEREAIYNQIQQERETAAKVEEEQTQQNEADLTTAEEFKKLKHELRRKQAQANVLEHEQCELVKRLTLAQESILERDKTIDSISQKQVEVEVSFKQAQNELLTRDEEILKLKNERNSLKIELSSTKEEKESFDTALHTIKEDMGKVEKSFRQMKIELAGRTDELTKVQNVNDDLNRQLAAARARLRVLTHNKGSPQGSQVALSDEPNVSPQKSPQIKQEDFELAPVHKEAREEEELVVKIVEGPTEGSGLARPEVIVLTKTEVNGHVSGEPAPYPSSSNLSDIDNAVIVELQAQRQALEQDLEEAKSQVSTLEEELKTQSGLLEQKLMSLQHELEVTTLQQSRAVEEKGTLEKDLLETKERVLEMERYVKALLDEKTQLEASLVEERSQSKSENELAAGNQEAMDKIQSETTELKTKMASIQKDLLKEIARQKAKVVKTTEEYEIRLEEERSRQLDFQALIAELNQRLRQVEMRRAELEAELEAAGKRLTSSLDEEKAQLQTQTQVLHQERHTMEQEKKKVYVQLEELHRTVTIKDETIEILRTKISEIEVQYREAKDNLEEVERLRREEDGRRLSLDLEREKGRLAGVLQSHTALKEHTSSLEVALARREASVAGLSTHVQGELHKRDKYIHDLQDKVRDLETCVAKEKQNVKDTKKQLMTEKGQHIKLRRQMEALWTDHDQVKVNLESKAAELQLVLSELEKLRHNNVALKSDTERMVTERQGGRSELEKLRYQILEHEKQDQMMTERVQTMEWQLTQKTAEIDALTEQMRIVEERQKVEVDSLNQSLQMTATEVSSLKEQLAVGRQEKMDLVSKVTQLKSALKASMSHSKKRKEMKEAGLRSELPPFDMGALERLLQDTAPVTVQSKPLSFLKATLNGLRGEISNLQTQITEHTSTVQTSSQAWKELEDHVKELRAVCKTSAAGRAASQTVTTADNTGVPSGGSTNGQTTMLTPGGALEGSARHLPADVHKNPGAVTKHNSENVKRALENV